MKKTLFFIVLLLLVSNVPSYAQQPELIDQIVACILNTSTDTQQACLQPHISPQINVKVISGNWVFIDEKGQKVNPMEKNFIVPNIDKTNQPFPIGCTVIMSFGSNQYAEQTRTCAPDPSQEKLKSRIEDIGAYTYKLTEPGMLQLEQPDTINNTNNVASCSLISLSGANYLICSTTEISQEAKFVVSFKKVS